MEKESRYTVDSGRETMDGQFASLPSRIGGRKRHADDDTPRRAYADIQKGAGNAQWDGPHKRILFESEDQGSEFFIFLFPILHLYTYTYTLDIIIIITNTRMMPNRRNCVAIGCCLPTVPIRIIIIIEILRTGIFFLCDLLTRAMSGCERDNH